MEFYALTPERWEDLVSLFQGHGAPGYCWCTYWRIPSSEYSRLDSPGRKQILKDRVDSGEPVGILAYLEGKPVGWCSDRAAQVLHPAGALQDDPCQRYTANLGDRLLLYPAQRSPAGADPGVDPRRAGCGSLTRGFIRGSLSGCPAPTGKR